jgi:peptidoglycan/xylan/chitin deacetylase (PgdA/CDA1 family)
MNNCLRILMWHNIIPSWYFNHDLNKSRDGFLAQLAYLKKNTYPMLLHEAIAHIQQNIMLPKNTVSLTFDDGYVDAIEFIAPALKLENIAASFYVCPDFLDNLINPWWEFLAWALHNTKCEVISFREMKYSIATPNDKRATISRIAQFLKYLTRAERNVFLKDVLDKLNLSNQYSPLLSMMSWDDLAELKSYGHEIGSHTLNHQTLSFESMDEQKNNIFHSKSILESKLKSKVHGFCYPNGKPSDYNSDTIDLISAANYDYAVTTSSGLNNNETHKFELKRWSIDPTTGVNGLTDFI